MLNKILLVILGIGIAFIFFPQITKETRKNQTISGITTKEALAKPEKASPEMQLNLTAPILTAASAVVFDMNSSTILFSKNLDQKLPIASLTKLMTALVVVENANLDDETTVRKEDLLGIGNTMGLVAQEKIKVLDLLKGMLIPSGNDAALSLASHIAGSPEKFAGMMNVKAKELNLVATKFSNPAGWDLWAREENFSNALDLLKITQEFLKHKELSDIVKTKEIEVRSVDGKYVHKLKSTNQLLFDDSKVEGVKTGFTSKALGNLITLYNHNGAYVLSVVLNSQNREQDTQMILDWTMSVYRW